MKNEGGGRSVLVELDRGFGGGGGGSPGVEVVFESSGLDLDFGRALSSPRGA